MARKAKGKGKKPSILGTGWRGGSFKAAVGGYLKKKAKKAGKSLKKSAKQAIWG
jgi:hypothetical protein